MTQRSTADLANLGPLGGLLGTWEGDKGVDIAPGADRATSTNLFRERITFTSIGEVDNHEQIMYGVAYAKKAWRLGVENAFHEDTGYFLWDPTRKLVMRCFVVPRGISVLAGGTSEANARSFTVRATRGSTTFGVVANPFLDEKFPTTAFEMTMTLTGDTLEYDETTTIQMPERPTFAHRDRNTLRRV